VLFVSTKMRYVEFEVCDALLNAFRDNGRMVMTIAISVSRIHQDIDRPEDINFSQPPCYLSIRKI